MLKIKLENELMTKILIYRAIGIREMQHKNTWKSYKFDLMGSL